MKTWTAALVQHWLILFFQPLCKSLCYLSMLLEILRINCLTYIQCIYCTFIRQLENRLLLANRYLLAHKAVRQLYSVRYTPFLSIFSRFKCIGRGMVQKKMDDQTLGGLVLLICRNCYRKLTDSTEHSPSPGVILHSFRASYLEWEMYARLIYSVVTVNAAG